MPNFLRVTTSGIDLCPPRDGGPNCVELISWTLVSGAINGSWVLRSWQNLFGIQVTWGVVHIARLLFTACNGGTALWSVSLIARYIRLQTPPFTPQLLVGMQTMPLTEVCPVGFTQILFHGIVQYDGADCFGPRFVPNNQVDLPDCAPNTEYIVRRSGLALVEGINA